MWGYLLFVSTLSATVLDERNHPIEGAVVLVYPRTSVAELPTSATSDKDGRVQIGFEGSRGIDVVAYASGYAVYRARDVDPAKPLSIVLERGGGEIRGVVRDGNTLDPVAGAIVETRAAGLIGAGDFRLGLIEAVTDERGEFTLEGLGDSPHTLTASAAGFGRAFKSDVAPGERVELYLFPGAGIYGRIIDDKGNAVEGALVSAQGVNPRILANNDQATDVEGRFAVLGLEPGRYRLFARHEDFAPKAREIEVTSEGDVEVEMALSRGVTLTGRLIDAEDEGIQGKVALHALDGGFVLVTIRSLLTVETDEEGFFSLGPIPPGEHTLRAEARGYGRKDVEVSVSGRAREDDVGDVVLEAGLAITGRVVDQNEAAIEGAQILAYKSSGGMLTGTDEQHESSSDADGRFIIAGLSEGVYDLLAVATGFGSSERIAAEPGTGALTIRLTPAGSIRGTVVDPEGRPVLSATVRARARDGVVGGNRAQGERGVFLIENVSEGEYAVEIRAPDFAVEALSDVVVSPGRITELGTIRLRRGGSVEGTVVDASSEPVPGASVSVRAPRRAYSYESYDATSDRLGRFQIRGIEDGAVQMVASHPSYADTRLERVEIASRSGPTEVEIVMRRGGSLEGYVRSRDGTDIAGRTIQVIPNPSKFRGHDAATAQTSQDGFFRFEHLPEGSVEVQLLWTAHTASYTVQRKGVEVAEGETEYVEFLSRRVLVSGRVTRGGPPLPGAELELWPVNAGMSMQSFGGMYGNPRAPGPQYLAGVSGEDGYYELLVDDPGEYRLSTSAHGVGLPMRTVAIPDVDSFSLDLEFAGTTLTGRVIDKETEAPIPGAYVTARPSKPGGSFPGVQVGADGVFELLVEPGQHVVLASAQGYGKSEMKIEVGEGGLSGLDFALSSGLRITGRAVGANGRGVAGLRVMAVEDSPDVAAISMKTSLNMSGADGSFVLDQLPSGRYNVLAGNELAGFALALAVAAGTEDLELTVLPGGKMEARVVDGEGNPVPGAVVGVVAVEGRKVRGVQGQTDANGKILGAVPRGNLTLKAAAMDGGEALALAVVRGTEAVEVEIVLAQTESNRTRK